MKIRASSYMSCFLWFCRKIEESQMEDIVEISREIPQQIIGMIRKKNN
jgi:hypothetical protein